VEVRSSIVTVGIGRSSWSCQMLQGQFEVPVASGPIGVISWK
jgi:hypothetical protein